MDDRTTAYFASLVPSILLGLGIGWTVFQQRGGLRPWGRLMAEIGLAVGWTAILVAIVRRMMGVPTWVCIPIGFVSLNAVGIVSSLKICQSIPPSVHGQNEPTLPEAE